MTTIQIRIDEKTKKSAQKVFHSLGMDLSTGITAYLKQVTKKRGIPFPLYTENGLMVEEEREIRHGADEARRGINVSGPYSSADELIAALNESEA